MPGKEWLLHIGDADLATVKGDFAKLVQDGRRRGVDGGLETGYHKVQQRAQTKRFGVVQVAQGDTERGLYFIRAGD